jgi:ABC-type bacteriocin/lantibiotic exporter with double-glycine peptidase domain
MAGLVFPLLLGTLVGSVLPSQDLGLLYVIGLAVASVAVFQFVLNLTRDSAIRFISTHFDRDAIDQLVSHVLRLPVSFFERHRPADILQRVASFRVLRELLTNQGLTTFLDLGAAAVSLVALMSLSPGLGAVLSLIVFVHVVVVALLLRPMSRLAAEEIKRGAAQQDNMLEMLNGITTLRATGSPTRAIQHWAPSFLLELSTNFANERINAVVIPALGFLRTLGISIVTLWGAWRVVQGTLPVGTLIGMQGVAAGAMMSVGGMVGVLFGFTRGAIHLRNIREIFGEKPEQESQLLTSPGKLRGQITVEHVSFRYRPDGPLVLDDVMLNIRSGMKVAVVGRSGSGKSTLGKLLVGAYVPLTGRIMFDGKDASHVDLGALRRQVGVVLQDTFLFGSSIRENLTLSAPRATMDDVQRAARQAAIAQDVEVLPMKYDTILAEGGGTFSGGQRQRLAIARALVSEPAVMLLDEATSALDNRSQAAVERSLSQTGCTRIVIAHRLSTVMDADMIVVMEAGRIVETGTHQELSDKKGAYANLIQAQTV